MSEQQIMKKSIFKQEVYKEVYNLKVVDGKRPYPYTDNFYNNPDYIKCCSSREFLECNIVYTIEIPQPLLNKGDRFYVEENDEIFVIHDVMRTSKDNVVYFIQSKTIADDSDIETLVEYLNRKYVPIEVVQRFDKLPFYKKMFYNFNYK